MSADVPEGIRKARSDMSFSERLKSNLHTERHILSRLSGSTPTPCPARVTAVLGFAEPTQIPCGLLNGHSGDHEFRIVWSRTP